MNLQVFCHLVRRIVPRRIRKVVDVSEWLSIPQVQEALEISEPKAYRLIEKYGLPGYRIGGRIKVREEDLRSWIDSKRIVPGSPAHKRAGEHSL